MTCHDCVGGFVVGETKLQLVVVVIGKSCVRGYKRLVFEREKK